MSSERKTDTPSVSFSAERHFPALCSTAESVLDHHLLEALMLTIKEAADRLCCSSALVYQLCARRKIAHARVGIGRGRIRIREEDLQAFLDGATVFAAGPRAPRRERVRLKHLTL
jgi:excisionase family DNA binding protein